MSRCGALFEWFERNGGYLDPIAEFVDETQNGIHVEAREDLELDEHTSGVRIGTCPLALSISYLNVLPESKLPANCLVRYIPGELTTLHEVVPGYVLSRFVLIQQFLLEIESFWFPYIACLPQPDQGFNTPVYFSDEDLKWLQGTNLASAAEERLQLWVEEWRNARHHLRIHDEPNHEKYTWELYKWAASIFTSRGFTSAHAIPGLDTFAILYPVLDSLNHQWGAKVEWGFIEGAYTLRILENIQAKTQILNNYGPKGNEELLMGYGFCIEDNPCDQVAIRLGGILPALAQAHIKNAHMREVGTDLDALASEFYLRGPDSVYRAYGNVSTCFRGIPSLLLLSVLVMVLTERGIPLEALESSDSIGRLNIGAIRILRVPIKAKYDKLLDRPLSEPQNAKQKYAKIYRDGQLKILQSILQDFDSTMAHLANIAGGWVPSVKGQLQCALIDIHTADSLLERENPELRREWQDGVEDVLVRINSAVMHHHQVEDTVWMLWFIFAFIHCNEIPNRKMSVIGLWLDDIIALYGSEESPVDVDRTEVRFLRKLINAAKKKHPVSAWALKAPSISYNTLWWILRVVKSEMFTIRGPGFEGKEIQVMYMHQDLKPEPWVTRDLDG